MKRPSFTEIGRKIQQAKIAVSVNNIAILKPAVLAVDALHIGIHFEEMNPVLLELFDEIRPRDYAGTYPPQRSYEDEISQGELFAFQWSSKSLGCVTYLKFAFKENRLWLVSLHEDRADSKGR